MERSGERENEGRSRCRWDDWLNEENTRRSQCCWRKSFLQCSLNVRLTFSFLPTKAALGWGPVGAPSLTNRERKGPVELYGWKSDQCVYLPTAVTVSILRKGDVFTVKVVWIASVWIKICSVLQGMNNHPVKCQTSMSVGSSETPGNRHWTCYQLCLTTILLFLSLFCFATLYSWRQSRKKREYPNRFEKFNVKKEKLMLRREESLNN